jgi:hypothetical protein
MNTSALQTYENVNAVKFINLATLKLGYDHLCGLVVRVSGYKSRGTGSIPGATRFPEKLSTISMFSFCLHIVPFLLTFILGSSAHLFGLGRGISPSQGL